MTLELPTKKVAPQRIEPRVLIIYSKPKMGKTTALSLLDNNLIIDSESGTEYLDALKIEVKSVKDILEVCKAIKANGCPYKFLTLDTITALEDIAKPYALQLWKTSPQFTDKYIVKDVTQIPNGAGYSFLREAIENVIGWLKQVCERVILVCHSKDTAVANTDLTVKDIDLLGKSGRVLASQCDAIGYLYRDDNNNTVLSFKRANKFAECEARPPHLTNRDIVVIENRQGELVPHWDRIYPSEPDSGPDEIQETKSEVSDLLENLDNEESQKESSESTSENTSENTEVNDLAMEDFI